MNPAAAHRSPPSVEVLEDLLKGVTWPRRSTAAAAAAPVDAPLFVKGLEKALSKLFGTHEDTDKKYVSTGTNTEVNSIWDRVKAAIVGKPKTEEEWKEYYTDRHISDLKVVSAGKDGPPMVIEEQRKKITRPLVAAMNDVNTQLAFLRNVRPDMKHHSKRTLEIEHDVPPHLKRQKRTAETQ